MSSRRVGDYFDVFVVNVFVVHDIVHAIVADVFVVNVFVAYAVVVDVRVCRCLSLLALRQEVDDRQANVLVRAD